MARYIDADALIDFIDIGHLRNPLEACFSERDVVDMLESRPTVDAAPVVHGKWVYDHWCEFKCSNCGHWSDSKPHKGLENYCPNCGAKMDGGNDAEEA